jgi:hypothetical protein
MWLHGMQLASAIAYAQKQKAGSPTSQQEKAAFPSLERGRARRQGKTALSHLFDGQIGHQSALKRLGNFLQLLRLSEARTY